MKKVRYAITALGVAPALGLITPAVNASANVAHNAKVAHSGKGAKRVSVANNYVTAGTTCYSISQQDKKSANGHFDAVITYNGNRCLRLALGILSNRRLGLSMRTRVYSYYGSRIFSHYTKEFISSHGETVFTQLVNRYALNVCMALVASGNHADVIYGPVCQTIPKQAF